MSLTRSLITQQHRPILDQLLVRLGLRQGQQQLHERLADEADAEDIVTLRTSVSVPSAAGYVPRLRWFTLVDPDDELIVRAQAFERALAFVPHVRARLDYASARTGARHSRDHLMTR
jgi:hypothetical protein